MAHFSRATAADVAGDRATTPIIVESESSSSQVPSDSESLPSVRELIMRRRGKEDTSSGSESVDLI